MKKINKKRTKKSKKKINENMTFSEIIKKHPETASIFAEQGMHCAGCPMAMYETLGQGAQAHGINANKITKDINRKLEKKKKREK